MVGVVALLIMYLSIVLAVPASAAAIIVECGASAGQLGVTTIAGVAEAPINRQLHVDPTAADTEALATIMVGCRSQKEPQWRQGYSKWQKRRRVPWTLWCPEHTVWMKADAMQARVTCGIVVRDVSRSQLGRRDRIAWHLASILMLTRG